MRIRGLWAPNMLTKLLICRFGSNRMFHLRQICFYIRYFVCLFLPLLWQSPLTSFEENSLRVGQTTSALVCNLRLRSKTRRHDDDKRQTGAINWTPIFTVFCMTHVPCWECWYDKDDQFQFRFRFKMAGSDAVTSPQMWNRQRFLAWSMINGSILTENIESERRTCRLLTFTSRFKMLTVGSWWYGHVPICHYILLARLTADPTNNA